MEGSKGGQPDTTGDAVEDPFGDITGVARISERSSDTIIGSALAIKNSHDPLQPGGGPIDDAHIAEKEPASDEPAKRELKPEDCEDQLGYAYPKWKKWWILTVIFLIQTSMNFNTSLYSNGIPGIAQEFNVSEMASRLGAAIFLLTYAFGCELWAPWSEEFGRKPILQLSLFLTNVWALPVVFAPSFTSVLVGRFLGGLSTAGGSVTLGMIPDLYDSDRQQYAIAYIVFSSVFGSVLGPIIGGFVQTLPPGAAWRWCIWIQVIFGGVVQLLHLITVPETRTTIILDSIAKKRRKANADDNIYGPSEMSPLKSRFSWSELLDTWMRPFKMLIREPIVRKLSLLSGFSDAIIFVQIQAMGLIYKQWNFNSWQIGLTFIPIAIGYFIGWMIFIPQFRSTQRKRELDPFDQWAQYESRLSLMRGLAPLLPVGLLVYAWTSMGPPIHWACPMIGSVLIGIANYAIYMATIDYMVCAYGPYSASATGGNGFARDLFAGILTMPSTLFYQKISNDGRTYQWASTILGVISAYLVYLACCVYVKGPELRKNSPFAQHLANREEEFEGHHISVAPRPGSVLGAAEAEAAAEAAAETAQDTGRTSAMENRQAPVGSAPVPVPVHTARTDIDVERGSSAVSTRPAFGPASSRGSYMASIQATSRRQSRQASRNTSQNPSRRTSSEVPHDHMGSFSGERLAARLQNLGTIDAVVNES
ncbi:MFS general substrate transporter [Xylaria sp. CBS 124048]|nr:MFS general substrate transporter [Xylaria sp. CBS 124048]